MQEVEKAWRAGITVVVASGNGGRYTKTNGYFTTSAPANDPLVITVGAMNTRSTPDRKDDQMTSYSSKGPSYGDHVVKPDIVAPGNKIFSIRNPGSYLDTLYPADAVPVGSLVNNPPNPNAPSPYYFRLSGTSMSAAAVERCCCCPPRFQRQQQAHPRSGESPAVIFGGRFTEQPCADHGSLDSSAVPHRLRYFHGRRRLPQSGCRSGREQAEHDSCKRERGIPRRCCSGHDRQRPVQRQRDPAHCE